MPTLAQIKDMTDYEVGTSLAHLLPNLFWVSKSGFVYTNEDWRVVNLTQSLDALQPIKEGLTSEQRAKFCVAMGDLCDNENRWIYYMLSAPASIQSRALLAALME